MVALIGLEYQTYPYTVFMKAPLNVSLISLCLQVIRFDSWFIITEIIMNVDKDCIKIWLILGLAPEKGGIKSMLGWGKKTRNN